MPSFSFLLPKAVRALDLKQSKPHHGAHHRDGDQAQVTTSRTQPQDSTGMQPQENLMYSTEIYLAIFSFLSPHDIARVACTCKVFTQMCDDNWVWRSLLVKKFGVESLKWCGQLDPPLPSKQIYKERITLCVPADKLDITWLSPRHSYWKLEDTEAHETVAGKAAVLRSVCWFGVKGQLTDVPVGKYLVVWRLLVEPASVGLQQLEFTAHTAKSRETASAILETTFKDNVRKFQGKGWVEYELPGVLNVQPNAREPFGVTVKFGIMCHTTDWKSGLRLDCVRLQRVG